MSELINKKIIITAKTKQGERALIKESQKKKTKQQKHILNEKLLSTNPAVLLLEFTKLMKIAHRNPAAKGLFAPLTEKAVLNKINLWLKAEGATVKKDYTIKIL